MWLVTQIKNARVKKKKATDLKRNIKIVGKKSRKSWSDRDPHVRSGHQSDRDVKAETNFRSEKEIMAFITLVCNGNWEKMTTSVTGTMT